MLVRAAASLLLALGCAAATPLPPSPACAVVAGWPRATVVAVDLLWSYLGQSPLPPAAARAQAAAALRAACSARGFSVLRLAGSAFWPAEMNATYIQAAPVFWAAWDALVADARAARCRLLPSLHWSDWLWPDLYGEPAGLFFNLGAPSRARTAAIDYTTALVTRYAAEPVIAGWEVGNEWNLNADLDMAGATWNCDPAMGTPAVRTAADNRTTDQLIALSSAIAAAIRAADSLHRPVSSGHALARPAAEHLRRSPPSWTPDSLAEFERNFADVNAHADLASVHVYAGADDARWNLTSGADILQYVRGAADKAGKCLYVGEFGDPLPGDRPFLHAVVQVVPEYGISLCSAWVWMFLQNSPTTFANFSLVPGRDDAAIAALQSLN